MLSWIFELNNYIFRFYRFFYRPPPAICSVSYQLITFFGGSIMDDYLKQYREMISLRGLTDHTIQSYSTYVKAYLSYLSDILHRSPEEVSWAELRDFIRYIQNSRDLSDRTVNACISQLRFFTMYVLHKPWDPTQLPMRKFDSYLPYVPSQQETRQFISTMPDLKQRAMTALMYSSGLRIGELCHLRYEDISRQDMRIHICHSKSREDRYAVLSHAALDLLTEYWFAYGRPKEWLFPKQSDPSRPIDTFFLSRHIHEHERRLGWEERLTCHSFRHAFGTHLYENGTDLLTIKALMGHKSLNSTVIYVHLSSRHLSDIVSPFDRMGGCFHE